MLKVLRLYCNAVPHSSAFDVAIAIIANEYIKGPVNLPDMVRIEHAAGSCSGNSVGNDVEGL